MPLWDGSTLNTTALSTMFNLMYARKAIDIASSATPLLNLITGKSVKTQKFFKDRPAFQRVTNIGGNRIEVRLMGRLTPIPTLMDGLQELALTDLQWQNDTFGSAQFDLTHYNTVFGVPSSEFARIKGNEAKTISFAGEKYNEIDASINDTLATALASQDVGATRTVMGNWQQAVSDGTTAGEAPFAVYGTINRADADNARYRGTVLGSAGPISLTRISRGRAAVRQNNGQVNLILAAVDVDEALKQLLETRATVFNSAEWGTYGAEALQYSGMAIVADQRQATGVVGMLDTDSFVFYNNNLDGIFQSRVMEEDNARRAARIIPIDMWTQLICTKPNSNYKLTGVTAS